MTRTPVKELHDKFIDVEVDDAARRLAEQVHSEWDRIEGEAGQQGELYQDFDAQTEHHLRELTELIRPEIMKARMS